MFRVLGDVTHGFFPMGMLAKQKLTTFFVAKTGKYVDVI
jgi:hypothetical protein